MRRLLVFALLLAACDTSSDALVWPDGARVEEGAMNLDAARAYVEVPLSWPEVIGRNIVGYRVEVDNKRVGHTSRPGFLLRLHDPAPVVVSIVAEGLYGQSARLAHKLAPPTTWPRGKTLIRRVRAAFGVVDTAQVGALLRARRPLLDRCMPEESASFQARVRFELKANALDGTLRKVSRVTVSPRAKRDDPTLKCLIGALRSDLRASSHAALVVEVDVGNPH